MEKQERIREMILQLKKIKEDKVLTNQDVLKMVEASGGTTSIASIRRVFTDGSENQGFNYRNTVQPIAHALLAVSEEESVTEMDKNILQAQFDGLKQACELKDTLINELQKELEAEQRKVAFFEAQLERYHKIVDKFLETGK